MAILGIDFGSDTCKFATVKSGVIDVVLNKSSERTTPSITSHCSDFRFCGDVAVTSKLNPHGRVLSLRNLMGLRKDTAECNRETSFLMLPYSFSENGVMQLEIPTLVEGRIWPIEAAAALLVYIKECAEDYLKTPVHGAVISCPGWYGNEQKTALVNACAISELPCLCILEDTSAVLLEYGFYRVAEFSEDKPTIIGFVGMGYSNTSICIAEFQKRGVNVIASVTAPDLGGRDLDVIIYQWLLEIIKPKFPMASANELFGNIKTRRRIMDAAIQAKRCFSLSDVAEYSIDCIYDDSDISGQLARGEFEMRCQERLKPYLEKLLMDAIAQSGIKIDDISAVEIYGGSTRVPWIQKTISTIFSKPISKTTNADECVVRGCAIKAAMFDKTKYVRSFSIPHCLRYEITLVIPQNVVSNCVEAEITSGDMQNQFKRQTTMNIDPATRLLTILPVNSFIPTEITLKMACLPGILEFFAHSQSASNQENYELICIATINVVENIDMALVLGISQQGTFYFKSAERVEIHEKEEKYLEQDRTISPRQSTPIPGENEISQTENIEPIERIRIVRHIVTTPLHINYTFPPQYMTLQEIKYLTEKEKRIQQEEIARRNLADARNEIEEYIYSTRGKLTNGWNEITTYEEKLMIRQQIDKFDEWLQTQQDIANLAEYKANIHQIKTMVHRFSRREQEYVQRTKLIAEIENIVPHLVNVIQTDPKVSLIPQNVLDEAKQKIDEMMPEIDNSINIVNNLKPYQESSITSTQINQLLEDLKNIEQMLKPLESRQDSQSTDDIQLPDINEPTGPTIETQDATNSQHLEQ